MSFEELKNEVMKLSIDQRAVLAKELLISLEDLSSEEAEKLWLDEAIRRDDAIDSGNARVLVADDVLNMARSSRK